MQEITIENTSPAIEGYQLSPQQTYIWQLQQQAKNQPYRLQLAVNIGGQINSKILQLAVAAVVSHHENLRTSFHNVPGVTIPLQVINQQNIFCYQEFDFTQFDAPTQQIKCEQLWQELKTLKFDLESTSLLHIYLLTIASEQHQLLISLPALCGDVISLQNLASEINHSYNAYLESAQITAEPLQYVDVATWQNELLTTTEAEIAQNYWQQQTDICNIKLPGETAIRAISNYQPAVFSCQIKSELVADIHQFLAKYQTSLDNFLLACWQVLLGRITGDSELKIATAFTGRKYPDLEPVIGILTKYLPITAKFSANQTINAVIQQIIDNHNQAHQWQEYYNWEGMINHHGNQLEINSWPCGYDFHEVSSPQNGWDIGQIYACLDKFKLRLSCIYVDSNLQLDFYYDPELLAAENIENLAAQFQRLLVSAITHPETSISQLDIISECDRLQLLYEFNNTVTDFPQNQLIHQLFEAQVEFTPDNIALIDENQQLTYSQLNTRANDIAHYLQQLGVKSETIIAICLERSIEAIVAILGILKAGGAYLPLDPSFPTSSIQARLADAQAQILLTDSAISQQHPTLSAPVTLCLDTITADIPQPNTQNPHSHLTTANLAYVIYTSGSTGKPKGVAIEHRQILNYLYSIQQRLELPNHGHFALVSTLAADLGHTSIFPALCFGGCLHLISPDIATNGQALAEYCRQHPLDCLKIVPSHLEALLTSPSASALLPKVRLILGGETCNWQLIQKIQSLNPQCRIINHYGPTETTVGVLTYEITQINCNSPTVPLGKPLANTQVYVLDTQLQPVPLGVAGELYIGGAGLARGYLNSPELTAEKFIAHPFNEQPQTKLYKTGDLVRYQFDGNLEFLGRIDNQVKIRGFRIELGEIEVLLTQNPSIQTAVVVACADDSGNQKLVAYVVPHPQFQPTSHDLRDFLRQALPEYMIPSAFVMLKALPLTANGKIDRQALPLPEQVQPELVANYVPPQTEIEKALAEIWAEVLGVKQVGIHDNFFDLGGHSLLLTQISSRVYNVFGIELSLRQIFATPTIAELALLVAEKQIEQTDTQLLEQMLAEIEDLPDRTI
jgi:amino acid adenylation domain-containing protein